MPDGKTLASGSADTTVRLWETQSGRQLHVLKGHDMQVNALAWSRDGKKLASASSDQSVRLWHAGSGEVFRVFRENKSPVIGISWRADGKTLVSDSLYNNLHILWEADSGRVINGFTTKGPWSWSPSRKVLVHATGTNTVEFWEADSGNVLRTLTLKEQVGGIGAVGVSPDGKVLATGSDTIVQLWDAESGKLRRTAKPGGGLRNCNQLTFSPDGKLLAANGVYVHGVDLWKVDSGEHFRWLTSLWHCGGATFSADGKAVFATTEGGGYGLYTIAFWDVGTAKRWHLQTYRADNQEAAWSPDGKLLASLNIFSVLSPTRIWQADSGQLRHVIDLPTPPERIPWRPAAWSPDGKTLAAATNGGVALWSAATQDQRPLTGKSAGWVHALAWSPDSKMLASFADQAWLWDTDAAKVLRPLTGKPIGNVVAPAWSPDGKTLAAANRDWTGIDLWNVSSGKHRRRLEGHKAAVAALAWSPDGKTLASGGADQTVRLWSAWGEFLIDLKDPDQQRDVTALSWLPGGKTLATLSSNNMMCIWDADSGKLLRSVKGPRGTGRFSPDGRLLASTNDVTGVRLWEVDSGWSRGTLVFLQPETPNQWLAVSADGHYRGNPPRVLDRELVYVVETAAGQETLSAEEFAKRYRWKNDPGNVRLGGQMKLHLK